MIQDLNISFGSISDAGLKTEFNTDAAIEFKILDGHVFVVCDGHNGVEGHGALAAKLVCESIKKYFYNKSYKDMAKALTNAITFANISLYEQSQKDDKYQGIGSTLAIVIHRAGKLYYAYAGDSRIYAFRDNKLKRLTSDHVSDQDNPTNSEVTVLLGKTRDIKFGVCKNPLTIANGDAFLVCTDGLSDQLSDDEIASIFGDHDMAPEHKCKDLIELANEKGGSDCTSVQVVEFHPVVEPEKKKLAVSLKPVLKVLTVLTVLIALAFGVFKASETYKNRPPKQLVIDVPAPKLEDQKPQEKVGAKKNEVKLVEKEEKSAQTAKGESKPIAGNAGQDGNFYNHKIVFGENLYRLAIRYNTTQQKLIDINGNKAKNLVAGSKLKIPVKALHTVKSGESFSVISDKYNVKIKLICQASNIAETAPLKDGQTLIIPIVK